MTSSRQRVTTWSLLEDSAPHRKLLTASHHSCLKEKASGTRNPGPGIRTRSQEPGNRAQDLGPETRGQGQRTRAEGPWSSSSSCHEQTVTILPLKKTSASFHQLSVPQCVRWRRGEAELCSVTQNISTVADEISFTSLRK